jgi:hypothetical protein
MEKYCEVKRPKFEVVISEFIVWLEFICNLHGSSGGGIEGIVIVQGAIFDG